MSATTAGRAAAPGRARTGSTTRARGGTLWLTGLSGSGKTTVANALAVALAPTRPVEVLDGDDLREHLSPGLGFTRTDRAAHVTRVGYLARLLARHGVLAIVPVIAPYDDVREAIRVEHEAEGLPFRLVHVATPLDECSRRDVKGLYAGHAAGTVRNLTGVDDPYDVPSRPDLVLDTTGQKVAASAATVVAHLKEAGLA
ncbi:MAG: adenylyl-sulfate kinase [Dermatophilaceae bacterium]